MIAHAEGDVERAAPLLEADLVLSNEIGNVNHAAFVLAFLGRLATDQGAYARASAHFTESLTRFQEQLYSDGIAFTLEGLAALAAAQGHAVHAARLFGAAEAHRELITSPMATCDRILYDRNVAIARTQLDETGFAAAWAEGRAMTLEQAIAYALEETG